MNLIVTQGLGNNQRLATSGYGYSDDIYPPEPDIPVVIPGPSVGTGGRVLHLPREKEKKQGRHFVVTTLLLSEEPHIYGSVEKFFELKVVRVSAQLEEHTEEETEIRVTAHLFGSDYDA